MPSSTDSPAVLPGDQQVSGCKAAKPNAVPPAQGLAIDIVDIRRATVEINLKDEILSMLNPTNGPRKLPTLLLYDERGLQLFEDVSFSSSTPHLACFGANMA
jgi:L-histidine Nalpha-methyltransferase / hercynylcysteine S-oxide synthase